MVATELLWKTGTPQILVLLADQNLTVCEITERVQVSDYTVRERIEEGKEYDWWAMGAKSDANDTNRNNTGQAYQLLPAGHEMARKLDELGVAELADRHREVAVKYQQRVEEVSKTSP